MNEILEKYGTGTQYVDIASAVTENELTSLKGENTSDDQFTKVKFIPASGAATRMFRDLYAYLENQQETPYIQQFFKHLEEFAFYEKANELIAIEKLDKELKENRLHIVQAILDTEMKYGDYPKALIAFHYIENN